MRAKRVVGIVLLVLGLLLVAFAAMGLLVPTECPDGADTCASPDDVGAALVYALAGLIGLVLSGTGLALVLPGRARRDGPGPPPA